jgi:hypothetical protein
MIVKEKKQHSLIVLLVSLAVILAASIAWICTYTYTDDITSEEFFGGFKWATERRAGYSFEVNPGWQRHQYANSTRIYYMMNDGTGRLREAGIEIYEIVLGSPETSPDGRRTALGSSLDSFINPNIHGYSDSMQCSDVGFGENGDYPFATYMATTSTEDSGWYEVVKLPAARFFVGDRLIVDIVLSCPPDDVPRYQDDFDRIIGSFEQQYTGT